MGAFSSTQKMGITGLLPLLKPQTSRRPLSYYKGKTAAIDSFGWLHKGAIGDAFNLARNNINHSTSCYLKYFYKYIDELLKFGITPILVFDGENLPSKAPTEKKRRDSRKEKLAQANHLYDRGNKTEAMKLFQQALNINYDMVYSILKKAVERKINYIIAPYEADIQICYLVKHGFADFAITEDSDLLVLGCPTTVFKMKLDCKYVDEIRLENVFSNSENSKNNSEFSNLTSDDLQKICVLSGCDYLPGGLPGFGLKTAAKIFQDWKKDDHSNLTWKMIFTMNPKLRQYKTKFYKICISAYYTFKHQIVYCPRAGKRRYFSELNDEKSSNILKELHEVEQDNQLFLDSQKTTETDQSQNGEDEEN